MKLVVAGLLLVSGLLLAGRASANCLTIPSSITSSLTGCYTWSGGNVGISGAGSISNSTQDTAISASAGTGTLTVGQGSSIISNNAGALIVHDPSASASYSLVNNGLLQNSTSEFTIFILRGAISTMTNSGQIKNDYSLISRGNYNAIGVSYASGVLTNLSNLAGGLITSFSASAIVAAYTGQIVTIDNDGEISTTGNSPGDNNSCSDNGSAIYNDNSITYLANKGSIYTNTAGAFGIYNNSAATAGSCIGGDTSYGSIQTLSNLQGSGGPHGALTFTGNLPLNYNIIVNSTNSFGQFSVSNKTGSMTFGIDSSSVLANGTYVDVLQGFSTLSGVVSPTSGTFNGFSWQLVANQSQSGAWNLVISGGPASIPSLSEWSQFMLGLMVLTMLGWQWRKQQN